MKKLLLLAALALSMAVSAQNFPGEMVQLLEGKELKIVPLAESSQKYGYGGFYTDDKLKKIYKEKSHSTPYDKLVGKTFKVISIEPYQNVLKKTKYKIKVDNADTDILYFDYDPEHSFKFPFEVVGGLKYPEGYFCNMVKQEESNEPNIKNYSFPKIDGLAVGYSTYRDTHSIALSANLPVDEVISTNTVIKGISWIFDNGEVINSTIDNVTVSKGPTGKAVLKGYLSTSKSTNPKFYLLENNKLVKIKFGKYEREFTEGYVLQEYVKCIMK